MLLGRIVMTPTEGYKGSNQLRIGFRDKVWIYNNIIVLIKGKIYSYNYTHFKGWSSHISTLGSHYQSVLIMQYLISQSFLGQYFTTII